jgi:hypothetical protein
MKSEQKRAQTIPNTVNHVVQSGQKANIIPQYVLEAIAIPWSHPVIGPSLPCSGKSMLSIRKVIKKARAVHSTHQARCDQIPVTGSITTSALERKISNRLEQMAIA